VLSVSGLAFAFAGVQTMGITLLVVSDVRSPPRLPLLAVDVAERERRWADELGGCWHALLHLSLVVSMQVS